MNKIFRFWQKFLEKSEDKMNSPITRIVILCIAAGFLAYGCMRGELQVVLGKAVIVCLECIGLG